MSKDKEHKDDQLIERFLDFELSESELSQFEERMEDDKDFKDKVMNFEKANYVSEIINKESSLPAGILSKKGTKTVEKKTGIQKKILLSLILLIIALIIGFWFFNQQSNNNEIIYAEIENYVTNITNETMRGESTDSVSNLSPIQATINDIQELNKSIDTKKFILELQALNNKTTDIDTKEIINWWLVKAYTDSNDILSLKETLQSISENDEFNSSSKAKNILESL